MSAVQSRINSLNNFPVKWYLWNKIPTKDSEDDRSAHCKTNSMFASWPTMRKQKQVHFNSEVKEDNVFFQY